jgi:hypothetical protein
VTSTLFLICIGACGRIGFDPGTSGSDAGAIDGGVDAATDGAVEAAIDAAIDAPVSGARRWRNRGDGAPGRLWSPRLAYHAGRETVILYGGSERGTPSAAMWELTDAGWSELCASCPPGARVSVQLAYDSGRGLLVLYGGENTTKTLGDHWEWDGATWIQVSPAAPPGARSRGQLIYDSARSRLVLIGGGPTGALSDVFEHDGVRWMPAGTAPFELSGAGAQAAYDETSGRTFVINQGGGYVYDELWSRASGSATWTRACDACTGRPRSDGSIVFDPATMSLYLINGYDDDESVAIAGTWQWRPGATTMVSSLPGERDSSGVAYDAGRSVIVLYGGNGAACEGDCAETWEMFLE